MGLNVSGPWQDEVIEPPLVKFLLGEISVL